MDEKNLTLTDYNVCHINKNSLMFIYILSVIVITVALYIFYMDVILSLIIALPFGLVYLNIHKKKSISDRKNKLRLQFREMLEAMTVAARASNNDINSLQSAYKDLLLIYGEKADIIIEIEHIIKSYNNNIQLKDLYEDFAIRTGIDDIESFANIYASIQGRSDRTDEIMENTTKIISDKIMIEDEIRTMVSAARSEQSVMFLMPILIVAVMNFSSGGFMDVLHTTIIGKMISSVAIIVFVSAYLLSLKITDLKV